MRILVASDIHGSASAAEETLAACPSFDLLALCGDYLNHGPRNPLPDGWNPRGVADALNPLAAKIAAVRGNCDSEVDEMVLSFPCLAPYTNIFADGLRIFVHHGHLFGRERLLGLLPRGTLVVSGHTHVPVLEEEGGLVFLNPGSVSLPKDGSGRSFAVVETSPGLARVSVRALSGGIVSERELRL